MSSRTPRPGWLLCLTLAAFAVGTDDLLIAGLLPVIAQDLHVGTAAAGQLVTVFSITYAVAAPPLAVATARLPRRALLLGALALFALVNLITALAPGYVALMALRVCAALVAALITPVAFAMAAGLSAPERTGRAVGMVAAGLTVSLFLGVPAGTVLGAAFGWRAAFVAVAALTFLVLLASAVLLPSLPGSSQTGPREQFRALARPAILFCVTGTVLGASCGFMTYTYVAPVTVDLTGSSGVVLAPLIATIGAAGALGTLACGRATDRWGADRVLLVTFVGMVATSVVLALLAPLTEGGLPVWALGGVFAVWGFAAWGFAAPMSARLLRLAGDADTEALALNTGGLYVGTAVAGMVGGAVVASSGGAAVPAAAAIIGLVALVVMVLSVRRYPTEVPEPLVRQGSGA